MAITSTLSKILSCLLVLVIMMGGLTTVLAQGRMVTGKVISSDDGVEIPGVNVLVKGANIGTSTDINGVY